MAFPSLTRINKGLAGDCQKMAWCSLVIGFGRWRLFSVRENQGKIFWNRRLDRNKLGYVEDTLTIPEAAQRLKIGVSTLRRYLRQRQLSYIVLPGNDHRIEPREIEESHRKTYGRRAS